MRDRRAVIVARRDELALVKRTIAAQGRAVALATPPCPCVFRRRRSSDTLNFSPSLQTSSSRPHACMASFFLRAGAAPPAVSHPALLLFPPTHTYNAGFFFGSCGCRTLLTTPCRGSLLNSSFSTGCLADGRRVDSASPIAAAPADISPPLSPRHLDHLLRNPRIPGGEGSRNCLSSSRALRLRTAPFDFLGILPWAHPGYSS